MQIGNYNQTFGITVSGTVDLSSGTIGLFNPYTAGAYTATGSNILFGSSNGMVVYAGSVNTGSVTGGGYAYFLSSGALTVDGSINQPGGSVYMEGTSFAREVLKAVR